MCGQRQPAERTRTMTARRCSISRRAFVGGATAALTTAPAFAQPASGTKWPERLVRIVIPYPAGGSTDVLARIMRGAAEGQARAVLHHREPPRRRRQHRHRRASRRRARRLHRRRGNGRPLLDQPVPLRKHVLGPGPRLRAGLHDLGAAERRGGAGAPRAGEDAGRSSSPGRRRATAASSTAAPASARAPHLSGAMFATARASRARTCPSAAPRRPSRRC